MLENKVYTNFSSVIYVKTNRQNQKKEGIEIFNHPDKMGKNWFDLMYG